MTVLYGIMSADMLGWITIDRAARRARPSESEEMKEAKDVAKLLLL